MQLKHLRLGLFGWPPVASHLTCIVVGLACAHFTRAEPAPRMSLASGQVLAALPKAPSAPPGGALHLVRDATGGACRASTGAWQLVERTPRALVRVPLADAGLLPSAAKEMKGAKTRLEPADLAKNLPICNVTPRISYGP